MGLGSRMDLGQGQKMRRGVGAARTEGGVAARPPNVAQYRCRLGGCANVGQTTAPSSRLLAHVAQQSTNADELLRKASEQISASIAAMTYSAEISRDNPTCLLFVIDQSGSMNEKMATSKSKADFVADVLNKTIYTLVTNCTKSDGVRNYFQNPA
jgi:hypothetical protein